MVVILTLLTILGFLATDFIVHSSAWKRVFDVRTDIMYDSEIGFTMADGGEPINKKDK